MFDFQKEVIINSNLLDDGVTPRFMALIKGKKIINDEGYNFTYNGEVSMFRVLRCADYKKEGLLEGVIYKTPGEKGKVASATFNVPKAEGTYRVVIGVTLIGKYLSDYAMPWSKFGKPVLAEFEVSTADLAKAQQIMVKAIESAIPENYRYVRVSKSSADKVLVSCTDSHHVGLMFIDLDNFKHYNDTFGHDVGDLILKEMAKIFRKAVKGRGFVARYGGDEFIMILNTDAREILEQIAKGIYEKINSTQGFQRQIENYLGHAITTTEKSRITCSIGIASAGDVRKEEDINELIRSADEILYKVKTGEKGHYAFL